MARRRLLPALCLALLGSAAFAAELPVGYLLVSGWYKDRGVQREYMQAVTPVLKANGYETAVIAGMGYDAQVIEGDWVPGDVLILLKFGNGGAGTFWWSPEYQQVRRIRTEMLRIPAESGRSGSVPTANSAELVNPSWSGSPLAPATPASVAVKRPEVHCV